MPSRKELLAEAIALQTSARRKFGQYKRYGLTPESFGLDENYLYRDLSKDSRKLKQYIKDMKEVKNSVDYKAIRLSKGEFITPQELARHQELYNQLSDYRYSVKKALRDSQYVSVSKDKDGNISAKADLAARQPGSEFTMKYTPKVKVKRNNKGYQSIPDYEEKSARFLQTRQGFENSLRTLEKRMKEIGVKGSDIQANFIKGLERKYGDVPMVKMMQEKVKNLTKEEFLYMFYTTEVLTFDFLYEVGTAMQDKMQSIDATIELIKAKGKTTPIKKSFRRFSRAFNGYLS